MVMKILISSPEVPYGGCIRLQITLWLEDTLSRQVNKGVEKIGCAQWVNQINHDTTESLTDWMNSMVQVERCKVRRHQLKRCVSVWCWSANNSTSTWLRVQSVSSFSPVEDAMEILSQPLHIHITSSGTVAVVANCQLMSLHRKMLLFANSLL